MATATTLGKVLKLTQAFVTQKGGVWNHQDWEALCDDIAKTGLEVTDADRAALGALLESMKHFHALAPAKKATAKAATKPAKKVIK